MAIYNNTKFDNNDVGMEEGESGWAKEGGGM